MARSQVSLAPRKGRNILDLLLRIICNNLLFSDMEWKIEVIEMTLDGLQAGDRARVVEIRGGRGLERRLTHMGIHPGDIVLMTQAGIFRGPLLIEVRGCRIALGRGVARRVFVAPI